MCRSGSPFDAPQQSLAALRRISIHLGAELSIMPGTDSTYAPRSPDLSSFSLPPNNSNINSSTSAYDAPQTQYSSSARGQGYTPRSPRISPQNDLERTPSINDRRTSYVPPTLQNHASKSPEVVNFQRRHSAYIPPSDLPALNTSYSSSTQPP